MPGTAPEDLLRQLAPQVLGALVRRYGHFDTAEDAVQEALLAAAVQWPADGIPGNPRGWLITVAARRLTDLLRAEQARQRREETAARQIPPGQWRAPAADARAAGGDDTLILLFMCCHPALSPASQIALTLRAVGGLSTAEIARAFLVPEATMTRRITRAKQTIKDSGIPFALPAGPERAQRLAAVLHVLYLIFTEGYAATSGSGLVRPDLSAEAIRLARMAHRLLPEDGEVTGLLALMLLTDARRPARAGPGGEPIPMAEQDRTPLGRRPDRGGRDADHRSPRPRVTRAVPAAGGDRRGPRRGAHRRGHRLAADRRPVRAAAAGHGQSGGGAEPRRGGGHGPRSRAPGSTCFPAWRPTSGSRPATSSTPSGPTCWRWPETAAPPGTATWRPPGARPACRTSATCTRRPAASAMTCRDPVAERPRQPSDRVSRATALAEGPRQPGDHVSRGTGRPGRR